MDQNKLEVGSRIFLDSDMAQYNFHENIVVLQEDVFLYKDYGNLSDEVEDLEIEYGQNEKLLKLIDEEGYLEDLEDRFEDCESQDEKDDAIIEMTKEMILENKLCDRDISTQMDYFKDKEIKSNWDNYECIFTSGYSQGDDRHTLINVKEAEKIWGNKPDLQSLEEEISHYIYDAPMCIRLNVNDNEYISEKDGWYDKYENYDSSEIKEEFISAITNDFPNIDSEILEDAISEVVPEDIESDTYCSQSLKTTIYLIDPHLNNIQDATIVNQEFVDAHNEKLAQEQKKLQENTSSQTQSLE